MDGARTLWTGFADEVDELFEKSAGKEGMLNRFMAGAEDLARGWVRSKAPRRGANMPASASAAIRPAGVREAIRPGGGAGARPSPVAHIRDSIFAPAPPPGAVSRAVEKPGANKGPHGVRDKLRAAFLKTRQPAANPVEKPFEGPWWKDPNPPSAARFGKAPKVERFAGHNDPVVQREMSERPGDVDRLRALFAKNQTPAPKPTVGARPATVGEAPPKPKVRGIGLEDVTDISTRSADLDDLGAMNRWLKDRSDLKIKIDAAEAKELGQWRATPSGYVDKSIAPPSGSSPFSARIASRLREKRPGYVNSGPYGRVRTLSTPSNVPLNEHELAQLAKKVRRTPMGPNYAAKLKESERMASQAHADRLGGRNPTANASDPTSGSWSGGGFESMASVGTRRVHWDAFADELVKVSVRRHFLPDGREVDLDLLEPQLAGRSVDTATEDEIEQSIIRPGMSQRLGSWFRQRIPFLFDEE